MSTVKFINEII